MGFNAKGSVSCWLDGLKAGDSVASKELWDRYFSRLVGVALKRLRNAAHDVGGEDIALSALKSVMLGVRSGKFPDLNDRTGLWPLLVSITIRKSQNELRRQFAAKRTVALEQREYDLTVLLAGEPSPEFAVALADEMEQLVCKCEDASLKVIASRKLEGFTNEEIAKELGVSTRTVIRKLKRIQKEWQEPFSEATGNS